MEIEGLYSFCVTDVDSLRRRLAIHLLLSASIKIFQHPAVFTPKYWNKDEVGYNVMKGMEYFVSLWRNVLITDECNLKESSAEIIGKGEGKQRLYWPGQALGVPEDLGYQIL